MGPFTRHRHLSHAGPLGMELERAHHEYADGTAGLRDITLRLDERRVAIIGLNGSGKTTLLRLMDGSLHASGGRVRIHVGDQCFDPSRRRDGKRIGALIGRVRREEIPGSYVHAPTIAAAVARTVRKAQVVPRGDIDMRVADLFARFGLSDSAHLPASALDGERRHLLAIVAAAATSPAAIIADEPTKGLDERGTERVATALFSCAIQVVFATHDISLSVDPRYAIERTILLHDRTVAFDGEPCEAAQRYAELVEELMGHAIAA